MPDDSDSSLFGIPLRQPPSNLMAERALLGALLSNNKAIEMCEGLRSEMFADAVNGRVFTAILRRISVGRIADAVSLKDDFENSETLEEVGSTKYLSELLGSMVAIINAKKYARAIRNLYMRRQLIDIGGKLVNKRHLGAMNPSWM